jgi:hypothetical protein
MSARSAAAGGVALRTVAAPAVATAVAVTAALVAVASAASVYLAGIVAVPLACVSLFWAAKCFARTQRVPSTAEGDGCNYFRFVEAERPRRKLLAGGCFAGAAVGAVAVPLAAVAGLV